MDKAMEKVQTKPKESWFYNPYTNDTLNDALKRCLLSEKENQEIQEVVKNDICKTRDATFVWTLDSKKREEKHVKLREAVEGMTWEQKIDEYLKNKL